MSDFTTQVQQQLQALASAERASAMSAYMKDQFPFLGIQTRERRSVSLPLTRAFSGDLLSTAACLWNLPEREYQYVAADLLRHHYRRLSAVDLPGLEALVLQKSWWDTVDGLAVTIGSIVLADKSLAGRMDELIQSPQMWLRRVALLHQLGWKAETDEQRLFDYCRRCAPEREFFIRKAIGWALRQYARTSPAAVSRFLAEHRSVLSGLSFREAAKHL